MAVLHINDDEVVASEAGDLSESGREAEEEEAIKGFAIVETRLQGSRRHRHRHRIVVGDEIRSRVGKPEWSWGLRENGV